MLRNTVQFSPLSVNQAMTSNKMKSSPMADHQHECYSKEATVNENLYQFHEEMVFQEGNSPENAGFRFSMSQLPKWARCKVTNNSLPADTDSRLCKDGLGPDFACLESQSPSKDILEVGQQFSETLSRHLSETDSSQVSPSPPETCSRALNNRWLTIHTVCMDLLDSPDTCDVKGLKVRGSATDEISQDQFMEATHYSKRIKLSSLNSTISNPPAKPNHSDHVNLHDAPFEEHKDVDDCVKDSQESEIFNLNFGNLSTQLKMDRDKTSTMGSYMSRFLLRRELLEGRRNSLCMHIQSPIGASLRKNKRNNSNIFPVKPSSLVEDAENDSMEVPDVIIGTEMPLNVKEVNVGDQEALNGDKVREVEIVRSCEEALHNLEAAAENALQSFCKLATVYSGDEKSRGVDIQLYAEAAARLPSIEKKILSMTKLLQSTCNFQRERQGERLS
ncbi:hypothetical protein CDL12_02394 [Handroanthus impetiginosus]|uniref:Uncharacterized protein n=1 Tax=Handroanthus impetiginosus TaxID=429701 RepID=A0A2G9I5J1_9LAMI|nr:hypothetical protein CDL12_02394 [Handroanthus impetiginosus]